MLTKSLPYRIKTFRKNYGDYNCIHPLDDVNRGQSTNDVYPTALRIASIFLIRKLSDACAALQTSLQEKENAFQDIEKLGRTEWMDAVPITLGEEFWCLCTGNQQETAGEFIK